MEDHPFLALLRFHQRDLVLSRRRVSHKESTSGFSFVEHRIFPWRFESRSLRSRQDPPSSPDESPYGFLVSRVAEGVSP